MFSVSRRSLAVLSVVLSSLLPAQAQTKPSDPFAAEPFVIVQTGWVYAYNADGTGYREASMDVRVQSDAAVRSFGVVSVEFAGASEHVEFAYARVRHADGTVTETPVADAIEQPEEVTRQAPFYSDLKQAQLPIRNLQVGDTLEWKARIVRTRAEAPNQFWGQESFLEETQGVALEEHLELRYPSTMTVKVWTNPHGASPKESLDGTTKVYRWTATQLAPTAGPDAEAAAKLKKTKVETPEEEENDTLGKLPAMAWTSFTSWQAVGAWYRGLEGSRAVPDDEIKAKVAELTAGKSTEEEKVRAVYAYVSAQIRYIGVAFGVGRFQPHEADDVLHNQYGDCKDKATLLASMLFALGLHPDTVLIGSEIRLNEAVPSPSAFNHAITHVKLGGDDVWLDSTAEVGPYKYLLYALRDKEALVIPEQGDALLTRTPKAMPFEPVSTWTATGEVDAQGVSNSHIAYVVRGDDEVLLRSVAHQVPPSKYNDLVVELMKGIGYQGEVTHGSVSRPEDTSTPFHIDFDYRRDRADDWKNLRVLPQLDPVPLGVFDEKNPPTASLNLGVVRTVESQSSMKIPAGWNVELPEAKHVKSVWATYDMTYRFDHDSRTVTADRTIHILQTKVAVADWRAYKKFTDDAQLGFEFYFMLQPNDSKHGGRASTVHDSEDTVIDSLHAELDEAFRRKDVKALEELLKKVKSGDPRPRRYWAWEASVAGLKEKYDEAIKDNRKELELYPDEADRWSAILYWQTRKKDKAGAEQTMRDWAAAEPSDTTPLFALANALLSEKLYPEAIKAAQEAVKRSPAGSPEAKNSNLLLGKIQIAAGQTEAGRATLAALLKSSDDAETLNDASYELADAKLELPLDEEKSRASIDTLTTESQSWTLDEKPETLLAQSSLLVASWDTLGWILFQENKFADARTFLLAARHNSANTDEKAHVKADMQALSANDPDAEKMDGELRTYALAERPGNKLELAKYRLLLSQGHVERVAPIGDQQVDGAEEMLKKVDFSALFPVNSKAKLVKTGSVRCEAGHCVVTLDP